MKSILPTFLAVLFLACSLNGQENPLASKPTKEHEFLKKFVGEWVIKSQSNLGEDQPDMEAKSIMKSRMMGPFWLINESEHDFGTLKVNAIQMIGYDPKKKKYIGTWNDSTSEILWHYEGSVNKAGNKLTLSTTGPDLNDPTKKAEYQDAFEFIDQDTIKSTSAMKGKDGKWTVFNEGTAKRKKK